MSENLLQAPEREAIEGFLKKSNAGFGKAASFERLLGFISGATITPGNFDQSDWLQPLFDQNGIVFSDLEDIEGFMATLTLLYDRVDATRSRGEKLFPFDLKDVEAVMEPLPIIEWATGLNGAVLFQEEMWILDEDDDVVDDTLKKEVNLNIQLLGMLVEPSSIPEIAKDPVPFQRTVLASCPGWTAEPLRESWDDELVEMFKYFCLARLEMIFESLQRFATAYDEGSVIVVDLSSWDGKGGQYQGPDPK